MFAQGLLFARPLAPIPTRSLTLRRKARCSNASPAVCDPLPKNLPEELSNLHAQQTRQRTINCRAPARASQNVDEFPSNYLPPGTKQHREQQRRLQEETGATVEQPPQATQQAPEGSPPPPGLMPSPGLQQSQKLSRSSELRQRKLESSLTLEESSLIRQRANKNNDQNLSSPSSPASAFSLQGAGSSMSDSQLDAVVTASLGSWFSGAPPPKLPLELKSGILEHPDPHVVSQAITSLMESQLEEAVKAVTYMVTKNKTAVLKL